MKLTSPRYVLALIATMVAFCAIVATASVTMEFSNDSLLSSQTVATFLLTVDNNDLAAITITPSVSAAEITAGAGGSSIWQFAFKNRAEDVQFDLAQYGFHGSASGFYCIEEQTKSQWFGFTLESSGALKSFVASSSNWAQLYNAVDGYGKWTFRCPIIVKNQQYPQSTNVHIVTNQPVAAVPASVEYDVSLAHSSSPVIVTPKIAIESVTATFPSASNMAYGGILHVAFHTNTTGAHSIDISNGPIFMEMNAESGHPAPYYCSVLSIKDSKKHYKSVILPAEATSDVLYTGDARILLRDNNTVVVHVAEAPKDDDHVVSCIFYLDTLSSSLNILVGTEKASIDLYIGEVEVSELVKIPEFRATASASVLGSVDGDDATFGISIASGRSLEFSNSPIRINSTIEFTFDEMIHVNTLYIPDDDSIPEHGRDFRGWTRCTGIAATIFVDKAANKIILRDVYYDPKKFNHMLSCSFSFYGDVNVDSIDNETSYVSAKIDDHSLISTLTYSERIPFHISPRILIKDEQTSQETDGKKATLFYSFALTDDYQNIPAALRRPHLVLSLSGPLAIAVEDLKSQLSCVISSPRSSVYTPINLDAAWSPTTLSWNIPLDSLVGFSTYRVQVRCQRSETEVWKNGVNVRQTTQLFVSAFDMVGKSTFATESYSYSLRDKTPTQVIPSSEVSPLPVPQHAFCINTNWSAVTYDYTTAASVEKETQIFRTALIEAGGVTNPTIAVYPTLVSSYLPASTTTDAQIVTSAAPSFAKAQIEVEGVYNPYVATTPRAFIRGGSASPTLLELMYGYTLRTEMCFGVDFATYSSFVINFPAIQQAVYEALRTRNPSTELALLTKYATKEISLPTMPDPDVYPVVIRTPYTGCGRVDGAYLTATYDSATSAYTLSSGSKFALCSNGMTCTQPTDCTSNICSFGRCAQRHAVAVSPVIDYNYAIYPSVREEYNSASFASFSVVIVLVAIAFGF